MRERWGFCIPGYQYYDVCNAQFEKFDRFHDRKMQAHEGIDGNVSLPWIPFQSKIERVVFLNFLTAIYSFVNGKFGLESGLIDQIVEKLQKISSWIDRQKHYKFYGSSILIAYNTLHLMKKINNIGNAGVIVRVKMIDFTDAISNSENSKDKNYADGLETLIEVFQNLETLHKISEVLRKSSKNNFL